MSSKSQKTNRTLRLDPQLLDQAKKVLGYQTYTQAIEETLKVAISNRRHLQILEKYRGKLKGYRSFY